MNKVLSCLALLVVAGVCSLITFRAYQAATATNQAAAELVFELLEKKTAEYNELKQAHQELAIEFSRLSFEAEDAIIAVQLYNMVVRSQGEYIILLQNTLKENSIPVPAKPNLEQQSCPPQRDNSAGNFFNSPRPTSQIPNALPRSPGGLCPRSLTGQDASGTVVSHEEFGQQMSLGPA